MAREAGVSTGTVSRVLNGEASVNEQRRQAVLDAIEKLGYRLDHVARALRSGSTRTIGVTVRTLRNSSVAEFVETVLETVAPAGYAVSVSDTVMSRRFERDSVQDFLQRQYDGVITLNPYSLRPYAEAREAGLKVVAVASPRERRDYPFDAIELDFETPGARLIECMYHHGHRRVNFVTPRGAYRRNPLRSIPLVMQRAIEVTRLADQPPRREQQASDLELLRHVLGGEATAIILRTESAPPILDAMRRLGLRIPQDVSVALWGHAHWRGLVSPPLDAVEIDYRKVSQAASEALLGMLSNRPAHIAGPFVGDYVRAGSVAEAPREPACRQLDAHMLMHQEVHR